LDRYDRRSFATKIMGSVAFSVMRVTAFQRTMTVVAAAKSIFLGFVKTLAIIYDHWNGSEGGT
jgi:hypothetical protein